MGVAAQLVFTFSWLLAPAWQGPAYRVLAHSISDLYARGAPGGAVMVVVLTVCGAATIGYVFAALLPRLRPVGRSGTVGAVLLALSIFGLGDLLTPFERLACRLADPGCSPSAQLSNLGGKLDATLSTIGIAILVASGFVLAAAIRRLPGQRRTARAVFVAAVVLVVLFFSSVVVPAGDGGLVERLIAVTGATMIVLTALPILRAGAATS